MSIGLSILLAAIVIAAGAVLCVAILASTTKPAKKPAAKPKAPLPRKAKGA